tara:strand:- start:872 stop:1228 length:357 start_codon:yes stop_codon:yes gene_type:complete
MSLQDIIENYNELSDNDELPDKYKFREKINSDIHTSNNNLKQTRYIKKNKNQYNGYNLKDIKKIAIKENYDFIIETNNYWYLKIRKNKNDNYKLLKAKIFTNHLTNNVSKNIICYFKE